jgi:hypothetical protein
MDDIFVVSCTYTLEKGKKMWCFQINERGEHIWSERESGLTEEPLIAHGYTHASLLGGFFVAVLYQRASRSDWMYILELAIGERNERIAIKDLPSLLLLLDTMAAILEK